MAEIVFKEESYQIIGACFEVYNEMGCGFLEPVYQECLEIELQDRSIPFVSKQELKLNYKQRPLKSLYIPDFVCFGKIILELKSMKDLTDQHRAGSQLSYGNRIQAWFVGELWQTPKIAIRTNRTVIRDGPRGLDHELLE